MSIGEQKYTVQQTLDSSSSDKHKTYILEVVREKAGNKLFKMLLQNKLPAVVSVDEKLYYKRAEYSCNGHDEEIEIVMTVTPVQHKHITIVSPNPPLSLQSNETVSLFGKIKRLLKKIW